LVRGEENTRTGAHPASRSARILSQAQSDYGLSTGLAVISEISELILPEHEVSEPMFRLILLAAREVERTGDWSLPLSYFAFWTVRLGGWLPRFDRCVACDAPFGAKPAYYDPHQPGLFCEKCRRPGMKPLHFEARNLVERDAMRSAVPVIVQQGSAASKCSGFIPGRRHFSQNKPGWCGS